MKLATSPQGTGAVQALKWFIKMKASNALIKMDPLGISP